MKDTIIETILGLLIGQVHHLFEWCVKHIDGSETDLDNFAFDILCYASTHPIGKRELIKLAQKTDNELDDKLVKKWIDFADKYLYGDERAAREIAKNMFPGLVK